MPEAMLGYKREGRQQLLEVTVSQNPSDAS